MSAFADLSSVAAVAATVGSELKQPGSRIWMRGRVGSGRGVLSRRLVAEVGAALVELPDLDQADAVAHGLIQAARAAGIEVDGQAPIDQNAGRIADALAGIGRPLILRLPPGWRLEGSSRTSERQGFVERARAFLQAFLAQSPLSVMLVADSLEGFRHPYLKAEELRPAEVSVGVLEEEATWGEYAPAAFALRRALPTGIKPNPLALRLAVGAVGLGGSPEHAAGYLYRGDALVPLVKLIVHQARAASVLPALCRFALVRSPLPQDRLLRALQPPQGHEGLFTSCLGYGDERVRISAVVRTALHAELRRDGWLSRGDPHQAWTDVHLALADEHEALDGVEDPGKAPNVVDWLEKVHHLAHAGPEGKPRWEQQRIVLPELLWDHGRALSLAGDYLGAVEIFQRCVKLDPKDAYAWHYLGFNLDRAGRHRQQAEQALREAVQLDPSNPWWNRRLVTFLIGQARFAAADQAWSTALEAIDPNGVRILGDPDLVGNLYIGVAKAWMDRAEVSRARGVLDRIPANLRESQEVREIEARVQDAEEAIQLGEAVRPPGLVGEERWNPQILSEKVAGKPLDAWYPGRVRGISRTQVELVLADPSRPPSERSALLKTLPAAEWKRMCNFAPEDTKGRFFEIGEYGDQRVAVLLPQRFSPRSPMAPGALRYLEDWETN